MLLNTTVLSETLLCLRRLMKKDFFKTCKWQKHLCKVLPGKLFCNLKKIYFSLKQVNTKNKTQSGWIYKCTCLWVYCVFYNKPFIMIQKLKPKHCEQFNNWATCTDCPNSSYFLHTLICLSILTASWKLRRDFLFEIYFFFENDRVLRNHIEIKSNQELL